MNRFKLMKGNNIELLKKLPDNSIDSIVSDPPYGLSFMNKKWDYDVPSVDFWKEVYRVLKPGGHILSFGGTRTYHRMVVNIEDAGFEIRDQIMWLYGSGFPKSHNIGKAVDKLEGNEREVVGTLADIHPRYNSPRKGGDKYGDGFGESDIAPPLTKGSSPYEGWGTALKPANEPICVARKPLSEKSVAENVLKWGTGGINIDGCRIGTSDEDLKGMIRTKGTNIKGQSIVGAKGEYTPPMPNNEGRFPANIILDEEAAELLDEQTGYLKSGEVKPHHKKNKTANGYQGSCYGKFQNIDTTLKGYGDGGGASRFFYIPKVSKKERNMGLDGFDDVNPQSLQFAKDNSFKENKTSKSGIQNRLPRKNNHPTVKPVQLMAYLCRLITPKNGIVLDPYMGSGSTGIAALLEGFRFCGMEMDEDYFKIAQARIENYESYREFLDKKKK